MSSGDASQDVAAAGEGDIISIGSETSLSSGDVKTASTGVSEQKISVSTHETRLGGSGDLAQTTDNPTTDSKITDDGQTGEKTNIVENEGSNTCKTIEKTDELLKDDKAATEQDYVPESDDNVSQDQDNPLNRNKTTCNIDNVSETHQEAKVIKIQAPISDETASNNDNTTLTPKKVSNLASNVESISVDSSSSVSDLIRSSSSESIKIISSDYDKKSLDSVQETSSTNTMDLALENITSHSKGSGSSESTSILPPIKSSSDSMDMALVEKPCAYENKNDFDERISLQGHEKSIEASKERNSSENSIDTLKVDIKDLPEGQNKDINAEEIIKIETSVDKDGSKSVENTSATEKEKLVKKISAIEKENPESVEISTIEKENFVKLPEKTDSEESMIFTPPLDKSAISSKSKETGDFSSGSQDSEIVLKWDDECNDDQMYEDFPEKVATEPTEKVAKNLNEKVATDSEKVGKDHTYIDEQTKSDVTIKKTHKIGMNVDDDEIIDVGPEKVTTDPTHVDELTKSEVTVKKSDTKVDVKNTDEQLGTEKPKSDVIVKESDEIAKKTGEIDTKSDETVQTSDETKKSDEAVMKVDETLKLVDPISSSIDSAITDEKMDVDTSGDTVDNLLANLDEIIKDGGKKMPSAHEKTEVTTCVENLIKNTIEKAQDIYKEKLSSAQEKPEITVTSVNSIKNTLDKAQKLSTVQQKPEITVISENSKEAEPLSKEPESLSKETEPTSTNKQNEKISSNDSFSIKIQYHRLTEPNMMTDIPSQELIDIDYSINDSFSTDNHKNQSTNEEINNFDDSIGTLVEELDKKVATVDKEVEMEIDTESISPDDGTVPSTESPSKKVESLSTETEPLSKASESVSKDITLASKDDGPIPSTSSSVASSKEIETLSKDTAIPVETVSTPSPSKDDVPIPSTSSSVASSKEIETLSKDTAIPVGTVSTPSPSKDDVPIPSTSSSVASSKEIETLSKDTAIPVGTVSTPSPSKDDGPVPVIASGSSPSKQGETLSAETESLSKEIIKSPTEETESIPSSRKEAESLLKESEPVTSTSVSGMATSKDDEPLSKDITLPLKETESLSKDTTLPLKEVEPIQSTSKEVESLSKDTTLPLQEAEPIQSGSKEAEPLSKDAESILSTSKEVESLSKEAESIPSTSKEVESLSKEAESIPSTSKEVIQPLSKEAEPGPSPLTMDKTPEGSEKVPEVPADTDDPVVDTMDSLGLLAESSRVMDDDDGDDPDTPEEDDEDDEDGDPNYDESSNMAEEVSDNQSDELSEDSNDLPKLPLVLQSAYPYNSEESMQDDVIQNKTLGFSFSMENIASSDIDISETTIKGAEGIEIASETLTSDIDISEAQLETTGDIDISQVQLEAAVDSITETTVPENDKHTKEKSPPKTTEIETSESSKSKNSILQGLLAKESKLEDLLSKEMSKTKKLERSKPKDFVNIVDLEESSSEDDVQISTATTEESEKVTSVNLPSGIDIDIMSSKQIVSDITTKKGEIIISGVPKPKPSQHKARLNTGELTIKTSTNASSDSTLIIPETKIGESEDRKNNINNFNLEVFSLDSDSDECAPTKKKYSPARQKSLKTQEKQEKDKSKRKCVNPTCKSGADADYYPANFSVLNHFECTKKKGVVCINCFEEVERRASTLIEGIKSFTPLLELEMKEIAPDLVEISDSDSDDEQDPAGGEKIGLDAAMKLESQLANMLNDTWVKYRMDERLQEAQDSINEDIARLEVENAEIHRLFDECQLATDKLREDLYNTFEPEKKSLPSVIIYDTNDTVFVCPETPEVTESEIKEYETRSSKRKLSADPENPAKRPAIPLGYASLDKDKTSVKDEPSQPDQTPTEAKIDEDKDISVVELSAEVAPPDLPPAGDIVRPALTPAMPVFAMRNAFGSWVRARVMDVTPKANAQPASQFTIVRVKFDNKQSKTPYKVLPARCIAYADPAPVRMTIGTRCIALFKDNVSANKRESYYSGVVAEVPNPVNKFRYLVFFDDGYAQYVQHKDTRLVVESSSLVWEEVHPFSREFVREYLLAYPERPMVRLHKGQNIKTEWNGKWWISKVTEVDASLVHVHFQEDNRTEWIYRGSTRLAPLYLELQSAERTRNRPLPRNRLVRQTNMPYVEYTRSDEQEAKMAEAERKRLVQERLEQDIRAQRAVAKKSTAPAPHPAPATANLDTVTSRVVYYTPKNSVKPHKMVTHVCSSKCKRTDVLALSDLRTYNPLAKPLLSGWERQLVRFKGHKEVMYRAPCGRRLRDVEDLHKYLRITKSDMGVDLFDFSPATHCLAEFVLNKCIVGKKDLSHGKENVPVPCVNYYDDSLPEFCSYNTERTPTAGVPLNIDPDFLCGCDCTDDCMDKSKCACWKMTLEGARTIGMDPRKVGYVYKRLPEPLPSGIYECNSRCKCKHTCLNRVAQHPLQLKLQVFKTLNRGWGIRALNDVPKGAFLCVYAGNLLTDATANLDGLNEGDEYLAELDYIEVVEQMKEGFEDDIPEKDKKLDKKGSNQESSSEEELSSSEDEEQSKSDKDDENFQPGYIPQPTGHTVFHKRLRRRDKKVKKEDDKSNATEKKDGKSEKGDDCITISDDEELREPSRFTAQAGMGANTFISKYQSVRTLYGKDEACYIMDAKVQGNIGRYLNHSCTPNVFVQNVFVDTHDPRFPWVAFFALSHIKAGTELTWNYNYDIGSVPGKTLYCYCGAVNCRGRLL